MEGAKGTVTALSSIYSPEEAQKAAKRVEDAIGEKQEEMDRLRGFISDNTNLINLVQKLPDQLHHDIMVNPNFPYSQNTTMISSTRLKIKLLNLILRLLLFWDCF